jgi:putative DNA primase/helicase
MADDRLDHGLASCLRTIAGARPEIRLTVFENQMREAAGYVRAGLEKHLVVDRMYDAALGHGLVATHGVDRIQKIIADSLTYTPATPCGEEWVAPATLNGHPKVALHARKPARLAFDVVGDVAAQPIDWVWHGRLARRKLTLIAGDPGLGKSQITADIAARISCGGQWPDQGVAPSGSTIVLSAEDSVGDTIRPRLEVVGADLRRIHALRSVDAGDGTRRTFSLQADLQLLGDKLKAVGDVGLVIIDPITSYMGKIDSHRTTDVRAVLEPLSEFAEHHEIAVLAVTHPPKATQAKALHAITGSLAFVAAARLVFIAVEEADTERRLLLPVKSNIGAMAPGLGYSLMQATTEAGIVTSHVVWDNSPVSMTANQALHAAAESAKNEGGLREAEEFLRDVLASGALPTKQVEKEAAGLGITAATLRRARGRLGVSATKDGLRGGWVLRLPGGDPR